MIQPRKPIVSSYIFVGIQIVNPDYGFKLT